MLILMVMMIDHDDVENKRGESARELPLFTVLSGFSANGVEFTDLPPPE